MVKKTKWSGILHGVAMLAGVLGALALIAAWIATVTGTLLGRAEGHWFNDATGLLLVSVAFGIGTLIHMKQEK